MNAEDIHCAVLGIRSPSHYKAEIEQLKAEIDALKAQNAELLMHVECCIEAYDYATILESGGMEDSISDAREYVEAIAKARGGL